MGEYFLEREQPGGEAGRMPWYGKRESLGMAQAWKVEEAGQEGMGGRIARQSQQ